jgi:hypothetical protein
MKILRGTVFGGIAYFLLGWLVYGIILMNYFSTTTNQSIMKPDNEMVWWAMIVSNLAAALLLTLILDWAKAKSLVDGFVKGAVFGALLTITIDLSFWSMTTMYSMLSTIVIETLVATVVFGVIGSVIVLTWGKNNP